MAKAGLTLADVDITELNEAFAAQAPAVTRDHGLPDDSPKVNPNGGAIALGHPLAASGARLMSTATYELARTGGRYGTLHHVYRRERRLGNVPGALPYRRIGYVPCGGQSHQQIVDGDRHPGLSPRTSECHVNSCYFTMVAVDDDGRPVAVPPLEPATEGEPTRSTQAVRRKKLRLELAKRPEASSRASG